VPRAESAPTYRPVTGRPSTKVRVLSARLRFALRFERTKPGQPRSGTSVDETPPSRFTTGTGSAHQRLDLATQASRRRTITYRPVRRRLESTDSQERPPNPLPWWLAASAAGFGLAAGFATPIEPGSRPPGVHSVRLLRPPEDAVLRIILVVPIFGEGSVLSRDRGGIFQAQRVGGNRCSLHHPPSIGESL